MTIIKNIYQINGYCIRRIYELFYVLAARSKCIFFGGKIISDVKKYQDFIIDVKKIAKDKRQNGISGFYRVKNEEDLLRASVESHIKYLDEIIIVYNDCSDRTPEIAKSLQKKYPEKIKVYEYLPKVYPVLSRKHMLESGKSPHSIVNYYNFTLSKTTRKIVVKIDADHIAVKKVFKQAVEDVKSNGLRGGYYFFHGVNIFECDEGVCVNDKNPFTYGLDCGFFDISKGMYFVHRRKYESLKIPLKIYFKKRDLGILFYHLKGFKKDRGTAFLDGTIKDDKKEVGRIRDVQLNPSLIGWDKFNDVKLKNVPHPMAKLHSLIGDDYF